MGSITGKVSGEAEPRGEPLRIRHYDVTREPEGVAGLRAHLPRLASTDFATRDAVAAIIVDVQERGDAAVAEYSARFDGSQLTPADWELSLVRCREALDRIPAALREALEYAADRIRRYHSLQVEHGFEHFDGAGNRLGMRVTPLDAVGLYVPGGKAAYPSSVLMNAIPAVVAGVTDIIAVTPPGGANDAVLAALAISGVHRIFLVGGAHAVAALACGTESIPRVDKIVGPGNRWVAEAKRQLFGVVGIDMIAGPTEVLILADETADADRIAADLIAQAEHDEDAGAWVATTSPTLAGAIAAALDRALTLAPRADIARAALERLGLIVLVPDRAHLAAVANLRASEHLEIATREPAALAGAIRHAGAIFLGHHTPEPVGDYVAGPSHVLPTGGTARYASPLGVYDFVKRSSVIEYTDAGLREAAPHIVTLAEAEGLFGHAEAIRRRMEGEWQGR
ncbi:MAG: histidinol dehydrogenase [Gemmatimonadota bacterium]